MTPTLRVLHIGKFYPPVSGGMETVLETLCEGERQSVETSALVMSRECRTTHEIRHGVPVTRVASIATMGAVAVAPTLPIWLARRAADVIVLHEPNPMALVAYFLARPRGRLIVWYHSEVIRPRWRYRLFYHPFVEFALRRAARIVVASPAMMEAAALAPHRHKCVVIPYGLPLARYQPSPVIGTTADALRRNAARPIVLFVGRLVPYKGIEILLQAAQTLPIEAVLIGDGPLRNSLQDLSRDLGIADRVRFLGAIGCDELIGWYHACDVLALPSISRQEAFGIVQLEAMACGRPVVSTSVGTGVSWVNQHEQTGLVVPPGDVSALTGALRRLLEDRSLRERLGAAARDRVHDLFTAERMSSAARSLYHELTSARVAQDFSACEKILGQRARVKGQRW